MPELPEVETIARDLRGLVVGARVVGAASNWPRTLRSHEPEAFHAAVRGRGIEGVGRRGKQLLVLMSGTERDPESAVMTVHLKMTGQLFVVEAGTPSDRHVHLVLALADGRELRFRDIRKFGRIGLYRRDAATGQPLGDEANGVLAAGDEPLGDEFTAARFAALLARRRGRVKTLLLNQDFVAGIGNIYADEALWMARIHPLRDARSLSRAEAGRLHEAILEVLNDAIAHRGSSVDDYTAPDGDGSMQERLQVYQRAGEPCHRCGRPIKRFVVGGRSTHFCSHCQRLPADQRAANAALLAALLATVEPRGANSSTAPLRPRPGPRWTELSGEGALGRTAAEEAAAAERARRTATRRKAAATRRAQARTGQA